MKQRIHLSLARMSGCEQQFIQEAFDTNWVVPLGPNVNAFEKDLETFIGQGRHIVALSSGTAAIHLGLLQLGIGPGDVHIFGISQSDNLPGRNTRLRRFRRGNLEYVATIFGTSHPRSKS